MGEFENADRRPIRDAHPPANGFLAIWSDIDPDAETDYLHWMTREHAQERLGIPGFLAMRMFRAVDTAEPRYFILYELRTANVVDSAEYLARLNHPSAWSQRMMPRLRNFVRGGGEVVAVFGSGRGGFVSPLKLGEGAVPEQAQYAEAIAVRDRVASVRMLATDHGRTAVRTIEKGMRTGDRSFAGLLLVEGLDAAAIRAAVAASVRDRPQLSERTVYETVFALDQTLMSSS